ncbi:MAG: DUF1553 domain-containing protein, partial [Planctomycetales bacterium]|nr:DUF1553 domain-containing protein [Planctomycetales bacterium]
AISLDAPIHFRPEQSGRLALAQWLTSPQHPLTSRVIVNRVWYHLMGQGIVVSVDNFGIQGDAPTHPELLDTLAVEFVEHRWSLKRLIRQIVLSRTYQMSSDDVPASRAVDPVNHLHWRANRRRLPAESIRDSLLHVSHQLDNRVAQSPVEGLGTLVTQNVADEKKYDKREPPYRSLFLPIIRSELPAFMTAFDFADPDLVVGRRPATNVPAQALLLMNDPFVMQCAEVTADLVPAAAWDDQIDEAYWRVLQRSPSVAERERSLEFLRTASRKDDDDSSPPDQLPPLAQLVHALMASIEFRTLE